MPKHKTRNPCYGITWEVNSLLMKFGQLAILPKKKTLSKNCALKVSS